MFCSQLCCNVISQILHLHRKSSQEILQCHYGYITHAENTSFHTATLRQACQLDDPWGHLIYVLLSVYTWA